MTFTTNNLTTATTATTATTLDVVVVGAGFAGLYALHTLRRDGWNVRAIEAGTSVGGTWFWNRYPGARCDVESIDYSYSFDDDLQQEWSWSERYARQPEILSYLDHVAERLDLRKDIEFGTRVISATFDPPTARWTLTTDRGETYSARYCVMATGGLSAVKQPDFDGLDDFEGTWYHTARWPEEDVDFRGKKVAVIGTGSTGIQIIPQIAATAESLTVFQRTPNFSVPARNRPLSDDEVSAVKATYPERRKAGRIAPSGVPSASAPVPGVGLDLEARQVRFQAAWELGGAAGVLRAYSDLMVETEVNDSLADFVRAKIAETVNNAEVAESLSPRGYPIGAKRLCVDTDYYQTYNLPHVTLVDLRKTPIKRVTQSGIQTAAYEHEFDIIVFAIGFDAITGALSDMNVRGIGGEHLADVWREDPKALLGTAVSGFPNLFIVNGPGSPAVLGNVVAFIEQHVDFISETLRYVRDNGFDFIEADPQAEQAWATHVDEVGNTTLYPRAASWYTGANVKGKARRFLPYAGGLHNFRAECDRVLKDKLDGFTLARI